jgi:hypothetical protein
MTDYVAVLKPTTQARMVNKRQRLRTLDWYSASTKPTQAELDAQWPTVDYNNQYNTVETTRRTQYEAQSDGIYFAWQRGRRNRSRMACSGSKSQSRQPISTSTKGYEMTVNNLPKFLILLVGLLCLTALMIADKIDMASRRTNAHHDHRLLNRQRCKRSTRQRILKCVRG